MLVCLKLMYKIFSNLSSQHRSAVGTWCIAAINMIEDMTFNMWYCFGLIHRFTCIVIINIYILCMFLITAFSYNIHNIHNIKS